MLKILIAAAALVVASISAHAAPFRCNSATGWCDMHNGIRIIVAAPMAVHPIGRPAVSGVSLTIGGERHMERQSDTGKAPVEGIRPGERFVGMSNSDAVSMCAQRGGRLVAVFIETMPDGRSKYKNECR